MQLIRRNANYVFIVKGNQKTFHDDIKVHFDNEDREPDHKTIYGVEHGRIDTRKIRVSYDVKEYLDFPHVRQVFMIKRESHDKKS
jgi:predicted transposase YbfD/YdcC